MNPALTSALASQHIRDLRQQVTRRQAAASCRESRRAGDAGPRPRLRSHLGFALIEAGCYMLAGARLASRD